MPAAAPAASVADSGAGADGKDGAERAPAGAGARAGSSTGADGERPAAASTASPAVEADADPVVAGALRTIAVPDHDDAFWGDLAAQLADEPQLRLRPRAAVRPITQPPPVIDDRLPFDDGGDLRPRGRSRKKRRRRVVVWLVAIALSIAVIAVALANRDDAGEDVRADEATTTTAPGGEGGEAPATEAPTIDPTAPLRADGVGPLAIGTPLRDLPAAGAPPIVVDRTTFDASGGTCFDARVSGVGDLVLHFRSPDPGVGIDDPNEAVLEAIAVDPQLGSLRTTEAGIGLGATEDDVRAAYPENMTESDHPYGVGHVFTVDPPDSENGIAIMTDGLTVNRIAVGATDLIGYPEGCPA
ncbi:MAG TPA: hypothetical protein VIL48_22780 [Acidimicrobiales bacterium]